MRGSCTSYFGQLLPYTDNQRRARMQQTPYVHTFSGVLRLPAIHGNSATCPDLYSINCFGLQLFLFDALPV